MHIYIYISEKYVVYIFKIFIYNINFMNTDLEIHGYILYKMYTVCVYLYMHNKPTQNTHILCKQKLLFCMRLVAINHLTALI